jgi:molecular chaperone DnaK (HSP70)
MIGATVDDKVPSVISYSQAKHEWGGSLSADSVSMVHTKLELGLQSTLGELDMTLQVLDGMANLNFDEMLMARGSHDIPAYSHKSPEEIVTDYLEKVFQYLEQEVEKFGTAARKHTAVDLVVTVPTVSNASSTERHRVNMEKDWSYMAMNSTYRALTKAGFNREKFPNLHDVMFITEPEAAALYTARHYRDEMSQDFLEVRQHQSRSLQLISRVTLTM